MVKVLSNSIYKIASIDLSEQQCVVVVCQYSISNVKEAILHSKVHAVLEC